MEAPSIKIKCGVDNCLYNKNRMCHANALQVNASGDGKARSREGTCCSTFVSK